MVCKQTEKNIKKQELTPLCKKNNTKNFSLKIISWLHIEKAEKNRKFQ